MLDLILAVSHVAPVTCCFYFNFITHQKQMASLMFSLMYLERWANYSSSCFPWSAWLSVQRWKSIICMFHDQWRIMQHALCFLSNSPNFYQRAWQSGILYFLILQPHFNFARIKMLLKSLRYHLNSFPQNYEGATIPIFVHHICVTWACVFPIKHNTTFFS